MAPITFAHRGARIAFPQNTMPAFRAGLAAGATGLESDAWLSSDGEVVLVHDRTVGGVFRRNDVRSMTAQELADRDVPRLADVYDELGTDFEFSIDAKHDDVVLPMLDIAEQFQATARLWLCHPSLDLLRDMRPTTAARLVHSCPKDRISVQIERHAFDLQQAGVDVMNFRHVEWTEGLVAMFHRFGVLAFAWDVQEIRHLRMMTAIGVDGIYCDRPERMVTTVAEFLSAATEGSPAKEI